jgi:XTP/dITP diphosphohydrolase
MTGVSPIRLALASSNPGKLREYQELAGSGVQIELLANFRDLPSFDESAPTFAENAAGKALYYSCHADALVLADDSGLVVPILGGAPGVQSARYAGPHATDADRCAKLLHALDSKAEDERRAYFVCVITIALRGRALAIVSDRADGVIAMEPRGSRGFGYDPVFLFPSLGQTYAELSPQIKNQYSHRGKAFRKTLNLIHDAMASKP